jgi:chromosome segregation ATPase
VKSTECRTLVVTVVVGLMLGLGSGCRQETTPEAKQARLIAAESMQLRKQLADCDAEMEKLKARHAKEIEQRQTQLEACQQRVEALQKDLEKGVAARVESVMATVMDENAKLRKEVEALRAEIKTLRAQQTNQP